MLIPWQEALIKPTDSIMTAMKVVDKQSLRAAFVVSDTHELLGIVTDGDIRRGLISGLSLDEPVSRVMNTSPLTCDPSDSPQSIRRLMNAKKLLHMPVVESGRLENVLTLQQLVDVPRRDNPVFLMAGGYGSRLHPLTDECPKPLLRVGSKPILETILESFIDSGFYRFYISTHYLPEMIRDHFGDGSRWGVEIIYTYEEKPLGTGGALALLPKNLSDEPLIMMNGDILTKVNFSNLLDYHNESDAVATMCVREHDYQVPYGVVEAEDFSVISMKEKPTYRYYVNAGIYVLNSSVISQVLSDQRIDMPTILTHEVNEKHKVSMYPLDEYWLDIGRMNDFEKAQQDVLNFF